MFLHIEGLERNRNELTERKILKGIKKLGRKSNSEVQHCGGRGYGQWTEATGERESTI